jgi:hypothetical protein
MKSAVTAPENDFPPDGHRPAGSDFAESLATRYLSAAAYLRRAMLPDEITELGMLLPRSPLPVGRAFAIQVLFRPAGVLPMPAVNVERVRRHCWAALWQTFFRDAAAVIVIACAALLDPWGTAITLGIILLVILVVGRVRLRSPMVLAVALGVTLALVSDSVRERATFVAPLICLAACFVIYLADILWSVWQVRRLWPPTWLAELPPATTPLPAEQLESFSAEPHDRDGVHGEKLKGAARQVYYDKDGIVGAGTPFSPLPLTVPLDKPRDPGEGVRSFTASELLTYIGDHLQSQGPEDGQLRGLARRPLPAPPARGEQPVRGERPARKEDAHFTYGLPHLDVGEVVARPVPRARKIPLLRHKVLRLQQPGLLPAPDVIVVADRSPSEHPERHYVEAVSVSWDGQLVASAYVSSALQGHYLRVNIRPYVLGPIVSDLRTADQLRDWHPFVQAGVAAGLTLRQFVAAARRVRRLTSKSDKPLRAQPIKRGLLSIRERYAQPITDNVHQAEDADRILRVIELKVIRVTMDYLRECNIDAGDFEVQITTFVQTNTIVGTGNIITGGTMKDSSVNATGNQGGAKPGDEKPGQ